MGLRGPAPTPTAILKTRGSKMAKYERTREPQPTPDAPPCPAHLDKPERAAWDDLAPKLAAMGVLTSVDGNALERYCVLWVRWRKVSEFIAKYGETYPIKDDAGKIKCFMPFPQVAIVNKLGEALLRLEVQFGLTPAARARIEVNTPACERDGDKEQLLKFIG